LFPRAGVVVTEPRLDPGVALLVVSVTLVVGVAVVATVVVRTGLPPEPPTVVWLVVVLPPEPLANAAVTELTSAKAWLRPATPEILKIPPKS
jgi:hypothetical protein